MRGNQRAIIQLLSNIFGGGSMGGVGANATKDKGFRSVQANTEGARPNADPISEQLEKKKKKDKEEKIKKKKRVSVVGEQKSAPTPSLNNKTPASSLGSLKIGLNLNSGAKPSGNKKKPASSGLNYQ